MSPLSGGQKQLLNLASIMAMQPSVLILDEPTSQLDPIAAADFLNTVRKINLELGTTVILSEHRLEEVFPCADRVIVMENGRIAAEGTPRNIGERLEAEHSDMVAALPPRCEFSMGWEAGWVPAHGTGRPQLADTGNGGETNTGGTPSIGRHGTGKR